MGLTNEEICVLKPLRVGPKLLTLDGENFAFPSGSGKSSVASLAERGYVRLSPTACGPLAVATGETTASLTEAGAAVLAMPMYDKDAAPNDGSKRTGPYFDRVRSEMGITVAEQTRRWVQGLDPEVLVATQNSFQEDMRNHLDAATANLRQARQKVETGDIHGAQARVSQALQRCAGFLDESIAVPKTETGYVR